MKLTLYHEEIELAVISYLVNKGYKVDDNSLQFVDDEGNLVYDLDVEVTVTEHPNE